MFCPKCGRKLPDGSKFCSGCGSPLMPMVGNQAQNPGVVGSPSPAYMHAVNAKKLRKSLIIGVAAVAAVVVVVLVVFLLTNVFGANKLVNGKYIFEHNNSYGLSYEIYEQDGKQKINIGYAQDPYGIEDVYYSGTFVEDGKNDQGIIWKLVPDEGDEDGTANTTIRFQFPEGYAEGNVNGRWYLERSTASDDGASETMLSIMEFDGGSLTVVTAFGEGALDGGLGVQDVIDNEVFEDEDIPEGKYYIQSAVDNTIEFMAYDTWFKVSNEGSGLYSIELISQDDEGELSYYDWMEVNIDSEE